MADPTPATTKCECSLDAIKTRLLGPPPVAGAYYRISVLEGMLREVRDALRESYMQIPPDQYPGPPISIIANINRVIGEPDV